MRALTNGGPRRLGALCAVAAVGSLLLAGGPAAHAVPDPDGTYVVPAETSGTVLEGVWSSEVGGITHLGMTFLWSDPTTLRPVPRNPSCSDSVTAVTGNFAVGHTSCDGGALFRIDLRTGIRSTRPFANAATVPPRGATDSHWILLRTGGIDAIPFDAQEAERSITPPEGSIVTSAGAAAGTAGVVYVVAVAGDSGPLYKLVLTAPDLVSHTVLAELGSSIPAQAGGFRIAMSGTAVAWRRSDTSSVGYVDVGSSPVVAPLPAPLAASSLSVVKGGVALGWPWDVYLWVPGQAVSTTPVPHYGGVDIPAPAAPASTPSGAPAFAINERDADYGTSSGWLLIDPVSGAELYRSMARPARHTSVRTMTASPGRVITLYGSESDWREGVNDTHYVYRVDDEHADLDLQMPALAAGSTGTRLAFIEPSNPVVTLVLRDETGTSARVPLPEWGVLDWGDYTGRSSVAASGPWTAVGMNEPTAAGRVVLPDGRQVATLPRSVRAIDQDGRRTLYVGPDGTVWLRDVLAPLSPTNPRRVTPACPTARTSCRDFVAISGRTIVVSSTRAIGSSVLRVYDTVTLTLTGSIALPDDAYEDGFDYALDGNLLLLGYTDGTIYSVDLAAQPWTLIARATRAYGPMSSTSTHLVWSVDTLDGSTFAVAPIGADWGDTGRPRLLGSWSAYGDLVSTGGPAWRPTPTFSGALDTWTFTIRSSTGAVVRTWTSAQSVPLGQINDVSWNARRATGSALPPGRYTWTVTGTGPNGSPAGLLGTGPAGGTVTVVVQHASSTRMTAAPVVDHRTRIGATLAATADGAPIAGEPLTLWRRVAGSTTWTQIATARTGSNGTANWSISVWQNVYYQVRHPSTPRWTASASSVRLLSP